MPSSPSPDPADSSPESSSETPPSEDPRSQESRSEDTSEPTDASLGEAAADQAATEEEASPKAADTLMTKRQFGAAAVGSLIGLLIAAGIALWIDQAPPEAEVQRAVLTTVQEESPQQFLVTGSLTLTTEVRIDSSEYLAPGWVTYLLQDNPSLLSMVRRKTQARVRVPGRVSYGFNAGTLRADQIRIAEDGFVEITLPPLQIYSVEPDLAKLEVRTSSNSWVQAFSEASEEDVRDRALAGVRDAMTIQAERRLETSDQPRLNTARALQSMLRPPLEAAGLSDPRFRIRISEDVTLDTSDG